jgi:uncharacterized membrane protein
MIILAGIAKSKYDISTLTDNWKLLLIIGLLSAGFNAFQFSAIQSAPNVGYVNAINAASIAAVTIGAVMLYKDEFSIKKFIGVIGVTIGMVLMLVG